MGAANIRWGVRPRWRSPFSLPSTLKNPGEVRVWGQTVGARGVGDTGRSWPETSTKQGSWANIEIEVTITEPVVVCAKSPPYVLRLLSYGAFVERLTVAAEVSLTLLSAPGTLFLLLRCLIQLCYEGFVLSYCILLCHVWFLSIEGLFFSHERQREGGSLGW